MKLDKITNWCLIITCVLVSTNVIVKLRPRSEVKRPRLEYAQGQRISDKVDTKLLNSRGSLLFYTASSCSYCTASIESSKRLAAVAKNQGTSVVALTHEDVILNRVYLSNNGLVVDELVSSSIVPKLVATPSVLVIDRQGIVLGSWQGRVSPADEVAMLAQLRLLDPKSLRSN